MSKLTLVPAYGREYKSPQEVQAAWESGDDFVVSDPASPWSGSYMNAEDVRSSKVASVHIRYKGGIVSLRLAEDIGGWDTGFVDTENSVWQTGEVVSREEDGGEDVVIGDGSQVPPPRDNYGTEIDPEGDPIDSIKRVASAQGDVRIGLKAIQQAARLLGEAAQQFKKHAPMFDLRIRDTQDDVEKLLKEAEWVAKEVSSQKWAGEGWEGLARRVQKAHSKKAGAWGSGPLDSDSAYDIMDDLQNKADRGNEAVNIIRYYLDKDPDYVYGALGAWDFLMTKGPVDWRKDLAKLMAKIKISAQVLLDDLDWLSKWNNPKDVEKWLLVYVRGKATGKLKYNFKIERWAIVGVETKHDPGKAWIQVNTGELNSGRADDMIISVSIDPGTGRLDVKS